MSARRLVNYATGETLATTGISAGLLHASRCAAPSGAVRAYRDATGLWLHFTEACECPRACSHDVVTVFVEES